MFFRAHLAMSGIQTQNISNDSHWSIKITWFHKESKENTLVKIGLKIIIKNFVCWLHFDPHIP